MIWYLLYPFRGSTEAPVLDQNHPLRLTFTRYGHNTARHPLITLLISIAVAIVLIFPFPFLYTNDFTNGSSNLPHHVWTSAQPFQGSSKTTADVVMRSIWVHGSYMKALETKILLAALEIQDHLLGSTSNFDPRKSVSKLQLENLTDELTTEMRDSFHAINGLSNQSWFFHSPLQYWSSSKEKIESDQDILTTINQSSRKVTSVNVTLRHSIVFSGKRFEDHRLVAADALVITLIHMSESPVGRQWERKAEELSQSKSGKWRLYPVSGKPLVNTLYEFHFQPLSLRDDLFLGAAYGVTFIYFIISLYRLHAFKSRLGLIIAVIAQIGVSIMASFTVCAVFKIDLSKIPREVYPLVVLTVGLENMFRLINAVIMTRSEDSAAVRIGEALGKTCNVALAGVSQNLATLWILSRYVYPQISAFCIFAAVAISLDFFFLLTFFSAILSFDVNRIELCDALNKATTHNGHQSAPPESHSRNRWTNALTKKGFFFSSRTAGTIILTGFVLIAQWHFFENHSILPSASDLVNLAKFEHFLSSTKSTSAPISSEDIHQARSPNAWLRMQDHETAHEVIQIVKPNATSYIARVYDPLVFVVSGSNRTPNELGVRPFLPAAYDFVKHQFGVYLLAVMTILAVVSLFLNYVLWDETIDSEELIRPANDPLISITTLNRGHALDIALLTTSNEGFLATVGLDRWIRIWNLRNKVTSYIIHDQERPTDPFPVLAIAINNDSSWLAILSAKDKIYLWNILEKKWGPFMHVKVQGRIPIGFFFGINQFDVINPLIVVHKNGSMSELDFHERKENQTILSQTPIVFVSRYLEKISACSNATLKLLFMSKKNYIHIASRTENGWVSTCIELSEKADNLEVFSVSPLPVLGSVLVVRECAVDLLDLTTKKITHTFSTGKIRQNTLRCFHSSRRRPQCGSIGLHSLVIAYNCEESGNCIMQIYVPRAGSDFICLRKVSNTCCLLHETVEHRFEIENPGKWEALKSGYLVGVRKREIRISSTDSKSTLGSCLNLRHRDVSLSRRSTLISQDSSEQELWEAWVISIRGERYTEPLCNPTEQDYLLISSIGPMEVMGKHSIAVGLGNMAKVISVGIEKFDGDEDSNDESTFLESAASRMARRKRPHVIKKKDH